MGYFKNLAIELQERGIEIPYHCGEEMEVFTIKDDLMECGCRECGVTVTFLVNGYRAVPFPLEAHEIALKVMEITERPAYINGNHVTCEVSSLDDLLRILGMLNINQIAYTSTENSIVIRLKNNVIVELKKSSKVVPSFIVEEIKEEILNGNH